MIGIRGGRKITAMAPGTLRRCTGKFSRHLVGMASAAVGNCMRANQSESPLGVLLEDFTAVGPIFRCVTGLAFCAQLTTMDVGMATGAR
jgi:hypothetical protein